ncbi:DUF58 domain-containing protein [Candidatus Poribacteria bacterium]|nr:DUF58 domain-containing protein [Candidatus Poribacteria bacterium]
MIVPQPRLLFWTGVVILPFSALAALLPATMIVSIAFMSAFIVFVIADAALASGRLKGIRVAFPEIVRLAKDREGILEIGIQNNRADKRRLRIALSLPAEFCSPHEEVLAVLPEGSVDSRVSWPFTALKRGNYVFENAYLEANSPVGFWAIRKTSPARAEVRVYPNTLREQKGLAALFLNRGMLGLHAQRQVGKGKEFEKLREYIPGDSYEDIHWKATAKRSHPITKVFQIERTQEVYVIIDSSRLSARSIEEPSPNSGTSCHAPANPGATANPGTPCRMVSPDLQSATQLERFVTAAMVLGLVAEKQGDLFGLLAFDDQVRAFIRARNGKAHYGLCRDALYTLQPKMANPDFGEAFSFIRLRLRRRALLIFLTNLDDPVLAEHFVRNLDILGRRHLVLVNVLTSTGVAPLFSDPRVATADDLYERMGGHIQWQQLRELERVLKRRGVSMTLLNNEMMCPQLVSQYVNVKRRQLL